MKLEKIETRDDHLLAFENVRQWARSAFENARKGDHDTPPAVIALSDEAHASCYVIAGMANEREKDAVADLMVRLVDEGAKAIAFISETWMVTQAVTEELNVMPSQHPNRIEAMYISYSFSGGEWGAWAEIKNNELGEWNVTFPDVVEGRFSKFWHRARSRHAIWN